MNNRFYVLRNMEGQYETDSQYYTRTVDAAKRFNTSMEIVNHIRKATPNCLNMSIIEVEEVSEPRLKEIRVL